MPRGWCNGYSAARRNGRLPDASNKPERICNDPIHARAEGTGRPHFGRGIWRPVPSALAPGLASGRGPAGHRRGWSGDGEHVTQSSDSLDMDGPSPGGQDVLLALGRRPQEVAHLIMSAAETVSAVRLLEAAHRLCAPFHPTVILLQMVVFVLGSAVVDGIPENLCEGLGIGGVLVGGDRLRCDARHRHGRAGERFSGDLVAVFAEADVDQGAITVDGPVQVAAPSADLQVGLVHVSTPADLAPTTLAQGIGEQGAILDSHSRTAS